MSTNNTGSIQEGLSRRERMTYRIYSCPDCNSSEVTTTNSGLFFVNTGEFYCHSTKTGDSDSRAYCAHCCWSGTRSELICIEKGQND